MVKYIQPIVCAEGAAEAALAVELPVPLEVLDDVGEQVGALHAGARGLAAQRREVHVEVVVRRLVVEVHPQLTGRKTIPLENGLLGHRGTEGQEEGQGDTERDTERDRGTQRGTERGVNFAPRHSFLHKLLCRKSHPNL